MIHRSRFTWFEVAAFAAVLLICVLLWTKDLTHYPPGLHYDEAIDLWGGTQILGGNLSLYITRGWGRETLFYYPLALLLTIVPNNVLALKTTAMLCSLGIVISLFLFLRRHTSFTIAWFAVAWYGVLYWTLYLSRSGIRGIIFPLMLCIVAGLFWRAWEAHTVRDFVLAGIALGLTWYTYQPARFIPFLFLAFFGYSWLFHRTRFKQNQQGILVFMIISALFAVPLAYVIQTGLDAEAVRSWTIEPYTRMMQGDFSLVWQNLIATAKLFTISGDPLVTYNVPNRPMFVPAWTSIFFYGGLLYALVNWRKPLYAYLLLWLIVTLTPTILTVSAPNHIRASGALPVICIFAALAIGKTAEWLQTSTQKPLAHLPLLIIVGIGLSQTALTARTDYFEQWQVAKESDWERNYNTRLGTIVRAIQSDPDTTAVLISTHSIEDAHPTIVGETLERDDVIVRWVNTAYAFAMPANADTARLYLASDRWLDDTLHTLFNDQLEQISGEPRYSQFRLRWLTLPNQQQQVTLLPTDVAAPAQVQDYPPAILPLTFAQSVQIDNFTTPRIDGSDITFFTWWTVQASQRGRSVSMFVHLIDAAGNVVAQEDALGYPVHTWEPNDRFVHIHRLRLSDEITNGKYWVQLGIYERETGQRWLVEDGSIATDRIVLTTLDIAR